MLVQPPIPVELFSIGFISIRWYSLMYIFGFLFYYWWTKREALAGHLFFVTNTKEDIKTILNDLLFYFMLGVIIGGRLGYAILYNARYYFMEDPLAILRPWEGGMSFHGAFVGVYLFALLALRQMKNRLRPFTLLDLSDVTLVTLPLGLGLGRFGNFINGELYGRPTGSALGMIFPRRVEIGHPGAKLLPIEQVQNIIDERNMSLSNGFTSFMINGQEFIQIPRHPSQLYQMLCEGFLTLGMMLFAYYKVPAAKNRGFLTGLFLILYGSARIFAEFFREPDAQIGFLYGGWLTAGMLYSIPMVIVGIGFIVYSLKTQKPNLIRVK